jgi:Family of unknown function (DUF6152)
MKAKTILLLSIVCGALWTAVPASAHHSFAAEFDEHSPLELKGVVTKVAWQNPHAYFYIDVESPEGRTENWAIALGSPNALSRRGWSRDTLQAGDEVAITGWRALDGSLKANAGTVLLPSGEKLSTGSSTPGGGTEYRDQ